MSLKLGTTGKERLRDIGLFGGLGDEALEQLSTGLEVLELQPGSIVFREGDSGREMFVLLAGEIEILKHSKSMRETRVCVMPKSWAISGWVRFCSR